MKDSWVHPLWGTGSWIYSQSLSAIAGGARQRKDSYLKDTSPLHYKMKRGELRTLAAEPWSEHWTWAVDVLI
jgi:hypothetical protein